MPLDKIGYFSFTRKAANEARDRFLKRNPTLNKKDIRYFQTLHSLAFTRLGLKEENVMQEGNYKKIGETCGVQIKYAAYEKNEWNGIFTSDSEYLSLISLARVKQISVLDQYNLNEHLGKIQRDKLEAIDKEINNYKTVYGLIDYTDMLDKFLGPQPFSSWSLNDNDDWEAPVTYPTDITDKQISWDEDNQRWTAKDVENNLYNWDASGLTWVSA